MVWPTVKDFILRAADVSGEEDEASIISFIKNKRYHLLVAYQSGEPIGAATIRFIDYPLKKVAVVAHLGGEDIDLLILKFDVLERWARDRGADSLMLWGRKGWERYLRTFGFEHKYTCLEKSLWEVAAET